MRAARLHGVNDIRVDDVPNPILEKGKVIVDVEWCGICGSDLHLCSAGEALVAVPMTLGHELCGYVKAVSTGSRLTVGDRVMVDPRVLCRSCSSCDSSATSCCQKLGYLGSSVDGGFAEQVAVVEDALHVLPESIDLEYAAVIEPLAVVIHAVKEANFRDWSKKHVLIVGGGPVGFALALALQAYGATEVYVSEPASRRREQIAKFTAAVFDPVSENVGEACMKMTQGNGVDVVFDCAGIPAGLETGFASIRSKGLYVNVALWEHPMNINAMLLLFKHVTVKGVFIFDDNDFTEAISLVAEDKVPGYKDMVTSRISLEDIVEKGFKELMEYKERHIKVLVNPKPKHLVM